MVSLAQRLRAALSDQRGYTMIELICIMVILGVLGGLVLANTTVGNKRQQLRDSASQYVSSLKAAEGAAVSGQVVTGANGLATPRKAYGVCMVNQATVNLANPCQSTGTKNAFTFYARDLFDTDIKQPPGLGCGGANCPPTAINTYSLGTATFTPSADYYVDYLPPAPKMYVSGSDATNRTVVITESGYSRCVFLKPRAGSVYGDICQ